MITQRWTCPLATLQPGPRICQWSLAKSTPNPWNHSHGGCWPVSPPSLQSLSNPPATRWISWSLWVRNKNTFMLEQVLVLLYELLASEPAVLVKQVDFEHLLLVLWVGWAEKGRHNEGEKVSECSVSHVLSEQVVVVWVEELCVRKCVPRGIQYQKHTGNIFVFRWLGRASNHPIRLGYYKGVRSVASSTMALDGTSGAIFLVTWRRSTIFLTDCSLWILVYLDSGKFWSRSPMRWVNVK